MAQVKHQTGGIVPSDIPIESQVRPAVVSPAPDIESQAKQEHTATKEFGDERAGMGMGVTLFISILVCLVSNIFIYTYKISHLNSIEGVDDEANLQAWISGVIIRSVSFSAAFLIAFVIAYGTCCAAEPHVKKWATCTDVILGIFCAIGLIGRILGVTSRLGVLCAIESVLLFSALVFSGLFIFGRRCGAPDTSG